MSTETLPRRPSDHEGRWALAAEWFGLLGGAVAWSAQLVLGNGFAEVGCEAGGFHGMPALLLAITAAAAIVTIVAGIISWTILRRSRRDEGTTTTSRERAQFMGMSGLVASGVFLALILMGGALPHLVLATCSGT
jgi:hypothetical protein